MVRYLTNRSSISFFLTSPTQRQVTIAHAERRIEQEDELKSMRRSQVECRNCDFAEETVKGT